MTIPNPDPELPPVERFFSFTESEDEHHGVKVTRIGMDGNIAIESYGKSHDLTFEDNRYQGASGGKRKKPAAKESLVPMSNSLPGSAPAADSATSRRAGKKASGSNPNRSFLRSPITSPACRCGATRHQQQWKPSAQCRGSCNTRQWVEFACPTDSQFPNNSQQFSREEQMLMIEAARLLMSVKALPCPLYRVGTEQLPGRLIMPLSKA